MEDAIELFELHERLSKSGRRYFVGTLNNCRIVVMQNDNVSADEGVEAVWTAFLKPGKHGRWQHTEKGRANAEARRSKVRKQNGERIRSLTDGTD